MIRVPVDPVPWSLLLIVALVVSFGASGVADVGARPSSVGVAESSSASGPADCAVQNLSACATAGSRLALTATGFQPGSAELPEALTQQLVVLGRSLRDQRAAVRVEVHTDGSGSSQHSLSLSQRRAEAIRGYLIEQGVDPYRVQAVGMGSARPLRPANPLAVENRRVEIVRL